MRASIVDKKHATKTNSFVQVTSPEICSRDARSSVSLRTHGMGTGRRRMWNSETSRAVVG